MTPASARKRLAALAIDAFLFIILCFVIFHCGLTPGKRSVLMLFVSWLIFVVPCATPFGAGPGNYLMGLRTVDSKGHACKLVRSTFRGLFSFISIGLCGMGYSLLWLHPKRQTLHDLFTNTLVIEKKDYTEPVSVADLRPRSPQK